MAQTVVRAYFVVAVASALHIDVLIHYPEKGSAVERCGLRFRAASSFSDPADSVAAERAGADAFLARVTLPDARLYEKATIGLLADVSPGLVGTAACQAICPKLGTQGQVLQTGPFVETQPLASENVVEAWPAFCKPDWEEVHVTFQSDAIGRQVDILGRIPASVLENSLPRPARMLPPIMFRLNSEWYWPNSTAHYTAWHDLMVTGSLHALVVAEVYIQGVDWQAWDSQPIYTTEALNYSCGHCDHDLQFICDSWRSSAYFIYRGGQHSFGSAGRFFDELYELGLPEVLRRLPARSDEGVLRVGMWGYCIGGLAAWNALASRPHRYNLAYLGSPAMDFDCGDPFKAVESYSWGSTRPRIYIDSGAAEGQVINRMTLMLLRKLQERGLVEGRDVFYTRAEFGTHQANSFLRRALAGLLVLFGTGSPGGRVYTPAMEQHPIIVQPDSMAMGGQWFSTLFLFFFYHGMSAIFLGVGAILVFILGRLSAARREQKVSKAHEPLLCSRSAC